MPTIKQLQLWIFLIISEEKNDQADGVRQNEKWKQLGKTEEGGHPGCVDGRVADDHGWEP